MSLNFGDFADRKAVRYSRSLYRNRYRNINREPSKKEQTLSNFKRQLNLQPYMHERIKGYIEEFKDMERFENLNMKYFVIALLIEDFSEDKSNPFNGKIWNEVKNSLIEPTRQNKEEFEIAIKVQLIIYMTLIEKHRPNRSIEYDERTKSTVYVYDFDDDPEDFD